MNNYKTWCKMPYEVLFSDLSAYARLVYVALLGECSDENTVVSVSLWDLAESLHTNRHVIKRALHELEDAGRIEWYTQPIPKPTIFKVIPCIEMGKSKKGGQSEGGSAPSPSPEPEPVHVPEPVPAEPVKRAYGANQKVFLTDDEYYMLLNELGQDRLTAIISGIDYSIAGYGHYYKNFVAAVRHFAEKPKYAASVFAPPEPVPDVPENVPDESAFDEVPEHDGGVSLSDLAGVSLDEMPDDFPEDLPAEQPEPEPDTPQPDTLLTAPPVPSPVSDSDVSPDARDRWGLVLLTDAQYAELLDWYGLDALEQYIQIVSGKYLIMGRKYPSNGYSDILKMFPLSEDDN